VDQSRELEIRPTEQDVAKPLGVIAGSSEAIFRSGDPRQGGLAAGD
jgi:hypothetical protein